MFNKQIQGFIKRTEKKTADVQRKSALEVFSRVVRRTPVGNPDLWKGKAPPGYVGGHARANWQLTVNSPAQGEVETAKAPAHIKAGDTVYITNNAPYIGPLEHGHSSQAPAGMVKVTLLEWESIVGKYSK